MVRTWGRDEGVIYGSTPRTKVKRSCAGLDLILRQAKRNAQPLQISRFLTPSHLPNLLRWSVHVCAPHTSSFSYRSHSDLMHLQSAPDKTSAAEKAPSKSFAPSPVAPVVQEQAHQGSLQPKTKVAKTPTNRPTSARAQQARITIMQCATQYAERAGPNNGFVFAHCTPLTNCANLRQ